MKKITITNEQYYALEGLAHWIAENAWVKERIGTSDEDLKQSRETIEQFCFPECDRLNIPFRVQNIVIEYASDWRRKQSTEMQWYLLQKGVKVA